MKPLRVDVSRRKQIGHIIRVLLAVVAVATIGYFVSWKSIADTVLESDPFWLTVCVLLLPFNQALLTWTWRELMVRSGHSVSFRSSLAAVLCGQTLGLITPARLGDFAGRIVYLPKENKWAIAAITAIQQFISFGVYVAFGIVSLTFFLLHSTEAFPLIWYLALLVGTAGLFVFAFFVVRPDLFSDRLLKLPIKQLHSRLHFLKNVKSADLKIALVQTGLRYFVFSLQYYVLLLAFNAPISAPDALVAIALVFFAKTVIPSPTLAELGIREGAAIYFFGLYSVSAAIAFSASFLLFAVNVVVPALSGIPLLLKIWFNPRTESDVIASRFPVAVENS